MESTPSFAGETKIIITYWKYTDLYKAFFDYEKNT